MEIYDIETCLNTMSIIVDSNEQPSERAFRRYNSFGCPYKVHKLDYGDYTFNCIMPNGKLLYDDAKRIYPCVVIERKMDLDELSGCFTEKRDEKSKAEGLRNRFEREFARAKANNASIYLLVENATWENLINGRYRTKYNAKAFFASLVAWMVRYDIKIIFCKEETSGKVIHEILYRELKNRLERGDFNGLCEDRQEVT